MFLSNCLGQIDNFVEQHCGNHPFCSIYLQQQQVTLLSISWTFDQPFWIACAPFSFQRDYGLRLFVRISRIGLIRWNNRVLHLHMMEILPTPWIYWNQVTQELETGPWFHGNRSCPCAICFGMDFAWWFQANTDDMLTASSFRPNCPTLQVKHCLQVYSWSECSRRLGSYEV